MKPADETLYTCPDCGQPNFTKRGLGAHRGRKACTERQAESKLRGDQAEARLRALWDEQGVPQARQDEVIASVTAAAQPKAIEDSMDKLFNPERAAAAWRAAGEPVPSYVQGELDRRRLRIEAETTLRRLAPLPTGTGDLTADLFQGGDTPLFNCCWAKGGVR